MTFAWTRRGSGLPYRLGSETGTAKVRNGT